MGDNWRQRIVIDPVIHHGEPCIKGTRVPVSVIVGSIAEGDTSEQILEAWPQLTSQDVKAALKLAAEAGEQYRLHPSLYRWEPLIARVKLDEGRRLI